MLEQKENIVPAPLSVARLVEKPEDSGRNGDVSS
jgi:hypothetical protein